MLRFFKKLFSRRRETVSGFPVTFAHVVRDRWPEAKRARLHALLSDPVLLEAIGTLQVRAASNTTLNHDPGIAIAENNRLRGYHSFAADLAELARPAEKEVELSEWAHIAEETNDQ